MPNFFDAVAPYYEKLRPTARHAYRNLREAAVFRPTDAVADIGGGTGAVAQYFVGQVGSITVVDPSANMLERCRAHEGVGCELGTAERLPFADASLDKIVMVDAFHHVGDQAAAMREILRVLKPGGTAILEEFDPGSIVGWVIQLFERVLRMGSTFHRPENLARLFVAAGFTVHYTENGGPSYVLVAKKNGDTLI